MPGSGKFFRLGLIKRYDSIWSEPAEKGWEAAAIGVPDPRWDERPLACAVLREGSRISSVELRMFLAGRVVKWWIPERWAFLVEIPKTSVGKFDKKRLRALQTEGSIVIVDAKDA